MSDDECVYFIQHGLNGPIKIGKSTGDASLRLRDLQTGNPVSLRLLVTVPGGLPTEARLHKKFAKLRRQGGEWFSPGSELLAFIEGAMWQKSGDATPLRANRSVALDPEHVDHMAELEFLGRVTRETRADCEGTEWEALYLELVAEVPEVEQWDSPSPGRDGWVEWATKLVGVAPPEHVVARLTSQAADASKAFLRQMRHIFRKEEFASAVASTAPESDNA